MANGTTQRCFSLVLFLLTCALGSGCSSVVGGLEPTDVIVEPELGVPGLGLASYAPALLKDDEEDDIWRVPNKREDLKTFHRSGLSLSAKNTVSDVLGDLDGSRFYSNTAVPPDQFLFVPDVEASAGFGINVNFRWQSFEMLLSWQETEYEAEFVGLGKDTTISYLDLLFREYFWIDSRIQPFAVAGLGVSEAKISGGAQDAGANLSTGELLDGINFNFGAGLAYFISPRLSVFGQGMYRLGRYDTIGTTFGDVGVESRIDSDGWELSFGVSLNLLDPWE